MVKRHAPSPFILSIYPSWPLPSLPSLCPFSNHTHFLKKWDIIYRAGGVWPFQIKHWWQPRDCCTVIHLPDELGPANTSSPQFRRTTSEVGWAIPSWPQPSLADRYANEAFDSGVRHTKFSSPGFPSYCEPGSSSISQETRRRGAASLHLFKWLALWS